MKTNRAPFAGWMIMSAHSRRYASPIRKPGFQYQDGHFVQGLRAGAKIELIGLKDWDDEMF
jgi:hypothetical protein